MLVVLSRQIIVIVSLSVWEFEGITQRFEAAAIGTNVCSI